MNQDKKKSGQYLDLRSLQIYQLSRSLSHVVWEIYQKLDWQQKKVSGDQFIRSTDSVGANIAEGYGRFHFLDKAKFYYNARGSLTESRHWFEVMTERELITPATQKEYLETYAELTPKLNAFIKRTKSQQR